jgi:hypothetical protein
LVVSHYTRPEQFPESLPFFLFPGGDGGPPAREERFFDFWEEPFKGVPQTFAMPGMNRAGFLKVILRFRLKSRVCFFEWFSFATCSERPLTSPSQFLFHYSGLPQRREAVYLLPC